MIQRLYFLGISGTAMGALAAACADAGFEVSGSDNGVYPPMSTFLEEKDIRFFESYSEQNISSFNPDAVVVGNAISRGNVELEYALDSRIELCSMPDLLRTHFIKKHTSVVISGTHGKTTTASITAWLLSSQGLNTGFFIGAITGNFGSGCKAVSNEENGYFVSEGDEYDTAFFDKRSKFLLYRPDIAVLNNIEFDHADIFSSIDDIKKSFRLFGRLVPRNGLIIANADDANVTDVLNNVLAPVQSFGLSPSAYWRAVDIHYDTTQTHFTALKSGLIYSRFTTTLAGEHNVRNILASIAVAYHAGLNKEQIQAALDSFILPKRRLEELGVWNGATVVDDFAHHPTAIRLTIQAAIQRYPNSKIIACFEPRSNTTSRNFFQQELVDAFSEADSVVLGCINRPERYSESERLNVAELSSALENRGKEVYAVSQEFAAEKNWGRNILEYFKKTVKHGDVILVLSNGDFGGLRQLLMNS